MRRANLKVSPETKERLDSVKRDGETWDECLDRLAQLAQVAEMGDGDA